MDEIDFEKEFGERSLADRLYEKYSDIMYLIKDDLKENIDINNLSGELEKIELSSDFRKGFLAGVKMMEMLIFK